MKKISFLSLFFLVISLIIILYLMHRTHSNSSTTTNEIILKSTYEQLDAYEKGEVYTSYRDGSVQNYILDETSNSYFFLEEEYYNKELYLVTFKSKNGEITGDIQKLVEKDNLTIVGYSFKD